MRAKIRWGGLVTVAQCGRRFQRTDYMSRVSGLGDGAGADGSCGVGGVSGAAGCGTAAGCFFWALVAAALRAAALRVRVFAAFCPAARCFRVATAFLAAARRLRVRAAFEAVARRFAAFRLRVVAAFFPALFLGLISSSVAIRERIKPEVACLCKACLLAETNCYEAAGCRASPGSRPRGLRWG